MAMYLVGMIGLLSPYAYIFLILTPGNLIATLALVLAVHRGWERKQIIGMLLIYLLGFGIEWLGVHTGVIFGEYSYGATLGFKLDEIPLLIGVNWLLLVYILGDGVARKVKSLTARIILGAMAMVALDILIEPVAIRFDMWTWVESTVPLANYFAWFIASLVMMFLFFKFIYKENNPLAPWVIIAQVMFFGLLNFV